MTHAFTCDHAEIMVLVA